VVLQLGVKSDLELLELPLAVIYGICRKHRWKCTYLVVREPRIFS